MCSATSWAASSGSFCFDRVHDLLMLNIELGAAMFGGPVRGAAPHATFGTAELAEGVVAALRKRTAALMGNHGALTVGATLAVACQRVPYREYVCEVHLRALSIVRCTCGRCPLCCRGGPCRRRRLPWSPSSCLPTANARRKTDYLGSLVQSASASNHSVRDAATTGLITARIP